MSGLFQGLEIAKRALLGHQTSMTTIGHNMANVSTPGYSRQRVELRSAYPIERGNLILGNGLDAQYIQHIRDNFLTNQYRRETKSLGEWTYREKALAQIEAFLNEPNEDTLSDYLNEFWNSWLDLSNNPESSAARSAVKTQANLLANAFHSLDGQFKSLREETDRDIVTRVGEINQLTREIASLNQQIVGEELGASRANDLRDQRDYLIDQLSQLVDVNTREKASGAAVVMIGAMAVVDGSDSYDLATVDATEDNYIRHDIVLKGTSLRMKISGGELAGLIETRDKVIGGYMDKLDDIAEALVTNVNAVHKAGMGLNGSTGLDFFDPQKTTAGLISVDPLIELDVTRIGASLEGEPGDNRNALAIAELRNQALLNNGGATINEAYSTFVGNIGIASREAKNFKANYEVLVQQIDNSRQSVQGVSLDEEMANLVKAQHAYEAAARVITSMDQALDTLISGTGIVGR
jgi:flagellar hook-associated protein 1 FlgK